MTEDHGRKKVGLWGITRLTIIQALVNKHWVVDWISFIYFFSPTFPAFVDCIFVITNTGKRVYFSITPAMFYLVFAYLVIYDISVPLAWPWRDRRLVRYHDSIADHASLFYASHLLYDPDSKCHFGLGVATLNVRAGEAQHVFFVVYDKSYWKEMAIRTKLSKKAERRQEIEERRRKRRQNGNRFQEDIV